MTYGAELAASWRPSPRWRLDAAYSLLRVRVDGPVLKFDEDATPQNMAQLRGHWDAGRGIELDASYSHVDRIPRLQIEAYDRADLGVAWRPRQHWRIELWGRNLSSPGHAEASGVRIPRDAYVQGCDLALTLYPAES